MGTQKIARILEIKKSEAAKHFIFDVIKHNRLYNIIRKFYVLKENIISFDASDTTFSCDFPRSTRQKHAEEFLGRIKKVP